MYNQEQLKKGLKFKFNKILARQYFNNIGKSLLSTNYGWKDYIEYFDFKYNVSAQQIIDGALKGIIMLQETYDLEIKEFSKGHLHLKDRHMNTSRSIDSLQPDDIASMSIVAFNIYKWYDNSISYLKESIDLFNTHLKQRRLLSNKLPSLLLKMKEEFSTYHNEMLHKKQSFIGPNWRLYPYMVDKGLPIDLSD